MLQKSHKDYGDHCDKQNLILAQTDSSSQALTDIGAETEMLSYEKALEKVQSWSKSYTSIHEMPNEHIPEVYDMRNVNGNDFTGPVRDQEHCGSCYGISFIQSLENRLKLKHGNDMPQLSVQ